MNSRRVFGQPAAPGLAFGRIFDWEDIEQYPDTVPDRPAVMPLPAAIEQAIQQLNLVRSHSEDADASAIIEFQIEFLSDPSLFEFLDDENLIAEQPVEVWCVAMDRQITGFSDSGDDYFLHRVSDLRDMRSRVLKILLGENDKTVKLPTDAIVVAEDIAPSRFLSIPWGPHQAIVLRNGSPSSHVAILARARALPMVVAVGPIPLMIGQPAIVNGHDGLVELTPDAERLDQFHRQRESAQAALTNAIELSKLPALTKNAEQVSVHINISDIREIDYLNPEFCDGIGLVRTELMFAHALPSETEQVAVYSHLLQWATGKPVVIRTLDVGGDKPFPGLSMVDEANPFLGTRGLRLSFKNIAVFKVQLRALMRAAPHGDMRVMFPMVTHQSELSEVHALVDQCAAELTRESIAFKIPLLGAMIEVPALALAIKSSKYLQFASIGTNDLLQYFMAAARDNPNVSALSNAMHPGFERLLNLIVDDANEINLPISVCGDLAAREDMLPLLLRVGLRSISVPPAVVPEIKQAIRRWPAL